MNNFKSGSGDLDFGSDESDEDGASRATQPHDEGAKAAETPSAKHAPDQASERESGTANSSVDEYPYFIRRSNVGDERKKRLELHVREKVADREAQFRSELAAQLGVSEVSKTDAREFALLAAFQNPERVADLMLDEGFGALD